MLVVSCVTKQFLLESRRDGRLFSSLGFSIAPDVQHEPAGDAKEKHVAVAGRARRPHVAALPSENFPARDAERLGQLYLTEPGSLAQGSPGRRVGQVDRTGGPEQSAFEIELRPCSTHTEIVAAD
jgi:hypothetical protein